MINERKAALFLKSSLARLLCAGFYYGGIKFMMGRDFSASRLMIRRYNALQSCLVHAMDDLKSDHERLAAHIPDFEQGKFVLRLIELVNSLYRLENGKAEAGLGTALNFADLAWCNRQAFQQAFLQSLSRSGIDAWRRLLNAQMDLMEGYQMQDAHEEHKRGIFLFNRATSLAMKLIPGLCQA